MEDGRNVLIFPHAHPDPSSTVLNALQVLDDLDGNSSELQLSSLEETIEWTTLSASGRVREGQMFLSW